MDRLSAIRMGARPAPVNVEIDLSNRCSLGCEWCHFGYAHTRGPLAGKMEKPEGAVPGGDLMETGLALRIVRELEDFGVRSVTWTGGGEPTLHPDFDRIVSTTRIEQGLYTHGGHIDERRAEILKAWMEWVYVSLDCADPVSYRRMKAADRFEAACQGVRNLVAAEGRATIGVGFLLTRDSWREGPKMLELGRTLGADYIQFRPTILYSQASPAEAIEDRSWLSDCVDWLDTVLSEPDVDADPERFRQYRDWRGHGYDACYWTTVQTCITPNGKVWACVNRREHAEAEWGDLTRESFADVWARSGPWTDFRRCRIMCRGHLPNQTLQHVMGAVEHANFP